jgi:iron(III) transport system ATP-binding protein
VTAIEIRSVTRRYRGGQVAVDALDLDVPPGTLLCLLGESGCGKTTLLRMLAGLDRADSGAIRFDGRPVDDVAGGVFVPANRRGAGLVFQHYALWPHMTVRQTVEYGLRRARTPGPERDRRVAEVLEKLGLGGLADRYPFQLSGGQQQRVALARTLVTRPSVLLLDEPLSNLDAALRADMREHIRALHEEFGCTTVFVTHDQQEAMAVADRIAVVHRGRLEQSGEPLEVYHRPATRHVARFVGSPAMNLLDPADPLVRVCAPPAAGTAAEVGVRPEDVTVIPLESARPAAGRAALPAGSAAGVGAGTAADPAVPAGAGAADAADRPGTLWTIGSAQPTGVSWICTLRRGPDTLTALLRDRPGTPGDPVRVALSREALHLFDVDGVRLPEPPDVRRPHPTERETA